MVVVFCSLMREEILSCVRRTEVIMMSLGFGIGHLMAGPLVWGFERLSGEVLQDHCCTR